MELSIRGEALGYLPGSFLPVKELASPSARFAVCLRAFFIYAGEKLLHMICRFLPFLYQSCYGLLAARILLAGASPAISPEYTLVARFIYLY
jgi:hypothetical protein